ncbi:helix-turn-helix domain-containing protein [Kitasatospora kifunensis]|uniref:PucR C-terminal helix-turn-helix domain-containing protein n=1 Tax=Kitasatospora kifunensis TaxID=58351 RepID=A0A7W7RAH1_KITKI|nr:helix-turn-helix domain-containing protein [Kitasatospora kifunensis]MBB4928344.1 hypothetical protein [Kitasatospora kifunensis]
MRNGLPRTGPGTVGRARRADDVLEMQRAARKGGTAPLLHWLATRTGAVVLLVTSSGMALSPPRVRLGDAERDLVVRGAREVSVRGLGSVAIDQGGLTCVVLPVDGRPGALQAPLLAAVRPGPTPPDLPQLLADASAALSLCWQLERVRRQQHRLRIADARTRQAVLQLLMNGQVSAARQVAGALRPVLPEVVRVYVVQGPAAARATVADALAAAAEDTWAMPCPVYAGHTLLLAPAGTDVRPDSATAQGCWTGVSDAVPLHDTATGYAQAIHALATARHSNERYASFTDQPDLALTIGPAAAAWAKAFLAPLRAHRAKRPQDPDGTELLATATSWLNSSSRATAHLKIHRNTLTARLTLIQTLLGLDLNRLPDQAALALALSTAAAGLPTRTRETEEPVPHLDELLALPGVLAWAQPQFHHLWNPDVPPRIAQTLTTWLHLDARIAPTATALSMSPSAVRKRLPRAEALLQRPLLQPSRAVYDQWLAQRALDLAEGP